MANIDPILILVYTGISSSTGTALEDTDCVPYELYIFLYLFMLVAVTLLYLGFGLP